MKNKEIIITTLFLLCVVLSKINIPMFGILLILVHLAYLVVLVINMITCFGVNSLLTFMYKMNLVTAILFMTNEYPGSQHLYAVGLGFAIISIIVLLVQRVGKKSIVEPLLFINIGSFIMYALR